MFSLRVFSASLSFPSFFAGVCAFVLSSHPFFWHFPKGCSQLSDWRLTSNLALTFQGVVKHLHLLPHELEDYEEQVEKVMRRYVKRLQWLLSGSRRVFGTITEKHVSTTLQ